MEISDCPLRQFRGAATSKLEDDLSLIFRWQQQTQNCRGEEQSTVQEKGFDYFFVLVAAAEGHCLQQSPFFLSFWSNSKLEYKQP